MKALRKVLGAHLRHRGGSLRAAPGSAPPAQAVSYEDMKKLVTGGKAWIFDVRSHEEVANGHIANSIHIPVAEVAEAFQMDPTTFTAKYGVSKPQTGDEKVVFYCQMGGRGARATETAVSLGYTKALNYAGGYKEWSEKEGH